MKDLDTAIEATWQQLFELHSVNGNKVYSTASSTHESQVEIQVDLPTQLKLLMQQANNEEQLIEELKRIAMKSYWDGYYAGFSDGTNQKQ